MFPGSTFFHQCAPDGHSTYIRKIPGLRLDFVPQESDRQRRSLKAASSINLEASATSRYAGDFHSLVDALSSTQKAGPNQVQPPLFQPRQICFYHVIQLNLFVSAIQSCTTSVPAIRSWSARLSSRNPTINALTIMAIPNVIP